MVFPHRLVRPLGKQQVNNKVQLTKFLEDIVAANQNTNCIRHFVADNLKRSNARESLNHAARFACEYCFNAGISIILKEKQTEYIQKQLMAEKEIILEKINNLKNKPSTSDNKEIDLCNSIVENIDEKLKQNKTKKSHIVWPFCTSDGEPRTHEKVVEITEKLENGEISRDEAKGIVGRSPLLMLDNFDIVRDVSTEYLHSVCLGAV